MNANSDIKALERQTADDLARSMRHNPSAWSWRDTSCDILCGPGGIRVGVTFLTVYSPHNVKFGFWNRRRIRRAFRAWKRTTGNDLANKDRRQALLALRGCLVTMRAVA